MFEVVTAFLYALYFVLISFVCIFEANRLVLGFVAMASAVVYFYGAAVYFERLIGRR